MEPAASASGAQAMVKTMLSSIAYLTNSEPSEFPDTVLCTAIVVTMNEAGIVPMKVNILRVGLTPARTASRIGTTRIT